MRGREQGQKATTPSRGSGSLRRRTALCRVPVPRRTYNQDVYVGLTPNHLMASSNLGFNEGNPQSVGCASQGLG